MTRATIAAGAFATVLLFLAVVAGYRALNQNVQNVEPTTVMERKLKWLTRLSGTW